MPLSEARRHHDLERLGGKRDRCRRPNRPCLAVNIDIPGRICFDRYLPRGKAFYLGEISVLPQDKHDPEQEQLPSAHHVHRQDKQMPVVDARFRRKIGDSEKNCRSL